MKTTKLQLKAAIDAATGAHKAISDEKRFSAAGLIGFSEVEAGAHMQMFGGGDNYQVAESFDDVLASFDGEFVVVTPLCCIDDDVDSARIRPSIRMALNPDRFTYRAFGDATVIAVEGVSRDLIVRETVAEIDALMDG